MAREDGKEEYGNARVCDGLGDNLSPTFAEVLAPGENDEVGGRLMGDRDDVVGGDAKVAEQPHVFVRRSEMACEELLIPGLGRVRLVIGERRHGRGRVDMEYEDLQLASVREPDRVVECP